MEPLLVHATALALSGGGILIRGPSGAGKSDLALRLIDRGALLVADDYLTLAAEDGRLVARAPGTVAGLLEVRGVGLVRFPHARFAEVALVVDIGTPDRLPHDDAVALCGLRIPRLVVAPFEASAPIKVELALSRTRLPLEGGFR